MPHDEQRRLPPKQRSGSKRPRPKRPEESSRRAREPGAVREEPQSFRRPFGLLAGGIGAIAIGAVIIAGISWMRKNEPRPRPAAAEASQAGEKTSDGGEVVLRTATFVGVRGTSVEATVSRHGNEDKTSFGVPLDDLPRWADLPPGRQFTVREMTVGVLWTKGFKNGVEVNLDWETATRNPGAPMEQGHDQSGRQKKVFVPSGAVFTPQLGSDELPPPNRDWQRALATLNAIRSGDVNAPVDESALKFVCNPQDVQLAKDARIPEPLFSAFGPVPDAKGAPDAAAHASYAPLRLNAAKRLKEMPHVAPDEYLPGLIQAVSSPALDDRTFDTVLEGLLSFPEDAVVGVIERMLPDPQNHGVLSRLIGRWSIIEFRAERPTPLAAVLKIGPVQPLASQLWTENRQCSRPGLLASGASRWIPVTEIMDVAKADDDIAVRLAVLRSFQFLPAESMPSAMEFATSQFYSAGNDETAALQVRQSALEALRAMGPSLSVLPREVRILTNQEDPVGSLAIEVLAATAPNTIPKLDAENQAFVLHELFESLAEISSADRRRAFEAVIDRIDPHGAATAAYFLDVATGRRKSVVDAKSAQQALARINPAWVSEVPARCRDAEDPRTSEGLAVALMHLFFNEGPSGRDGRKNWSEETLQRAADVLIASAADPDEQLCSKLMDVASQMNRGPNISILEAGLQHPSKNVRITAAREAGEGSHIPVVLKAVESGEPAIVQAALESLSPSTATFAKDSLVPAMQKASEATNDAQLRTRLKQSIEFLEQQPSAQ